VYDSGIVWATALGNWTLAAPVENCAKNGVAAEIGQFQRSKPPPNFARRIMFSELQEGSDTVLPWFLMLGEVAYIK
jgi:hypothetical protein